MAKPAAKKLKTYDAPELAALGLIYSGKENAINNSDFKLTYGENIAKLLLIFTASEIDQFNCSNLPSMRGEYYLLGKPKNQSNPNMRVATLNKDKITAEIFLTMIKAPFAGMQGEDVFPALANTIINTPLIVLELALNLLAKALMVPHVLCRNQFDNEKNPLKKAGWAIASALTWLPGALGLPLSLASKACAYTRALIDSSACLLNAVTFSPIGDAIRSLAGWPKQHSVSLPLCAKSFLINTMRLAVIGGAIAACVLIPGSLLAAPIVNATATFASLASAYLTACAVSFIASASSGLANVIVWQAEKNMLASDSKPANNKPPEHSPIKVANTRQITSAIQKRETLKPAETYSERLDESTGVSLRRPSQSVDPNISHTESRASDHSEAHLISSAHEISALKYEQAMDFLFNSKLENKSLVMEAIQFAKSDDLGKEAKMDAVPKYIEALQNARQEKGMSEPMKRYFADTIEKINDFQPRTDHANRPSMS